MQKLMLLLLICFGASFAVCAQKTPPAAVVTAFNQKFQNVQELEWEKEKNGEWEAEFEPVQVDDFVAIRAHFHQPIKNVQHETISLRRFHSDSPHPEPRMQKRACRASGNRLFALLADPRYRSRLHDPAHAH